MQKITQVSSLNFIRGGRGKGKKRMKFRLSGQLITRQRCTCTGGGFYPLNWETIWLSTSEGNILNWCYTNEINSPILTPLMLTSHQGDGPQKSDTVNRWSFWGVPVSFCSRQIKVAVKTRWPQDGALLVTDHHYTIFIFANLLSLTLNK